MTTRSLTRSRGLRMSLLGLTASASIVAGVFVAATPAYSDDGVPDVSASCLVATEEDATVHVSSILHAGEPVHAEGSGWGPSSDTTRGFVIVTLDDGKERRPADTNLPGWVPAAVARDRSVWAVLEVDGDGSFSADIAVPSTWEVGSSHQIAIGDDVTGTNGTVSVTVVDAQVAVRSCSVAVDDLTPVDPDQRGDAAEPGGDVTAPSDVDSSASTVMSPAVLVDEQAEPVTNPQVVLTQPTMRSAARARPRPRRHRLLRVLPLPVDPPLAVPVRPQVRPTRPHKPPPPPNSRASLPRRLDPKRTPSSRRTTRRPVRRRGA